MHFSIYLFCKMFTIYHHLIHQIDAIFTKRTMLQSCDDTKMTQNKLNQNDKMNQVPELKPLGKNIENIFTK